MSGVSLTHRAAAARGHAGGQHVPRARASTPGRGVAAFLAPTLPELPALLLGAQVAGIASSLNYLLTPGGDLRPAQRRSRRRSSSSRPASSTRRAGRRRQACSTMCRRCAQVLVIGGDGRGPSPAMSAWRTQSAAAASDALDFEPSADRDTRVRAVPYRRHDGPPEARPADARQPDPCRLRVRARCSATTSATSSSTASRSSMSAAR